MIGMIGAVYILTMIAIILTCHVLYDILMSDLKGKELIFAVFPILALGFIIARYFN